MAPNYDFVSSIHGGLNKLLRYLQADGTQPTRPPKFKKYKSAPKSWKEFPRKKPGPGQTPVTAVPETKSKAIGRLYEELLSTTRDAEDLASKIKKAKAEIDAKFGGSKALLEKEKTDKVLALWRILEKNQGQIKQGANLFVRLGDAIIGARGERVQEPAKMPPDTRVDAAFRFIEDHVPGLLKEFQELIEQIETEFEEAQSEASRTAPREIGIYDISKVSSLHLTSGMLDSLLATLGKIYRQFTSFLTKTQDVVTEAESMLEMA